MSTYARRAVSGQKARFKDKHLNVDLDLVYLTDRIILMGYPASGVAAFYRNKGEDARRFLEHRHQSSYWVFNFCPLNENQYPASLFDGRVSRYPFPDHHAPPMALLALATREMDEWLSGDPDRVIVLHCKAGKGRTGTLACAYLLACGEAPSPPKLQRSYTSEQWAKLQAEQLIRAVDSEDSEASSEGNGDTTEDNFTAADPQDKGESPAKTKHNIISRTVFQGSDKSETSLDGILSLHTARRMKVTQSPDATVRRGVSISSQRRFLYYWSLLVLSPEAVPRHFWTPPALSSTTSIIGNTSMRPSKPKVWLKEIRVRLREPSSVKKTAINLINSAIESVAGSKHKEKGKGEVWVSLARYNDDMVELLERREKETRGGQTLGKMGKRQTPEYGDGAGGTSEPNDLYSDGRWDSEKMVRSFARLGEAAAPTLDSENTQHGRVLLHKLHPLPIEEWVHIHPSTDRESEAEDSDTASIVDEQGATDTDIEVGGILLDADREVRAKLYMGQVPMGWFWFIPAFHMPQPPPESDTTRREIAHFVIQRRKVDFPLGPGSWLIDVDVLLQWAGPHMESEAPKKPSKAMSADDAGEMIAGAVTEGTLGGVVEAVQAEKQ